MEDFLIFVLFFIVAMLALRLSGTAEQRRKLEDLRQLVSTLKDRITALERTNTPAPPPPPAKPEAPIPQSWIPPQPPPSKPTPPLPAVTVSATLPPPNFVAPAPAKEPAPLTPEIPAETRAQRSLSMEERLGKNWLSKLGIIAVVIGIALYLGPQLLNLGPLGKSIVGLALGLLILTGGIFLERNERYRTFARAAIGGGWALTFFVTFALYHLPSMQVIHSQATDLVLMLLVAAAMVAHSLRYQSQAVTSLAFLLAFVTVGISEVTLFSLVAGAILAIGLIYVAFRERWFELALAGLIGVYLNHFLWLHRVLPDGATPGHPFEFFLPSAALLLLYWLLFRLFTIFRVPNTQRQQLVSTSTAILNSVGLLALLKYQSSHPEWAFYGLLTLGAAELALAFLARRRNHTAFVVLAIIASGLLLAAIPFKFSGSNWSLLWLLEAEILFLSGIALRELVFRRLGTLAAFATTAQLFITGAAPIFNFRQWYPDATHHLPVAIALLCAAILFWINAEALPRRFPILTTPELDSAALTVTSYIAAIAAAAGLWVFFPGAWTILAWLILATTLGFLSDKLTTRHMATQADLLAVAAFVRAIIINFQLATPPGTHLSTRAITVTLAAALFYLHMRRRTRAYPLNLDYIPAAYSWAAAALLATLLWYELHPAATTVAWAVYGLILLELGLTLRKTFLRHQGCALLAASFIRLYFVNLTLDSGPRLYTVIPLIAAYFWTYERLHSTEEASPRFDQIASALAAWLGMAALASLAYFEIRAPWIAIAWAILALIAMTLAWTLKRQLFTAQAIVLLLAAATRTLLYNLFAPTPLAASFTTGRLFTVAATCAVMLLTLPLAFALRRAHRTRTPNTLSPEPGWQTFLLGRPEQLFFFVPFLLITVLLAIQLRAGMITIAWSILALLTFLFALALGERSFRLAGLSLLLLCVGKIVFIDIWHASRTDRDVTLIVLGIALLSVSFLYSRYRETILKLL